MDKETKEKRENYLKALPQGEPISISDIIKSDIWPPSAAHSGYWTGTGPGSRIAFNLGLRVEFSNKLLTITIMPLTDVEMEMRAIQFGRALTKSQTRTAEFKRKLDSLLGG